MSGPWKSQNDFHRPLEISHTTRDFHIPTAAHRLATKTKRQNENTARGLVPCPGEETRSCLINARAACERRPTSGAGSALLFGSNPILCDLSLFTSPLDYREEAEVV